MPVRRRSRPRGWIKPVIITFGLVTFLGGGAYLVFFFAVFSDRNNRS